jgi:hypothetical protein
MRHISFLAIVVTTPLVAFACSSGSPSNGEPTPTATAGPSAAPTSPTPTPTGTQLPPQDPPRVWEEPLGRGNAESLSVAPDGDFILTAKNPGFAPIDFAGSKLDGTFFVVRTSPQGKVRWAKAIRTFGAAGYDTARAWARGDGTVEVLTMGLWVNAGDTKHEPTRLAEQWVLVTYDKNGELRSTKKMWETTSGCLTLLVDHRDGQELRFVCEVRDELVVNNTLVQYSRGVVIKGRDTPSIEGSLTIGTPAGLFVGANNTLLLADASPGVTNFLKVGTDLYDSDLVIDARPYTVSGQGERMYTFGTGEGPGDSFGVYQKRKLLREHRFKEKGEDDSVRVLQTVLADAKGAVLLASVTGEATLGTTLLTSSEGRGSDKADLVVLQVSPSGAAKARVLARPGGDYLTPALTLLPDGRVAFISLRDDGAHLQVIEREAD